MRRLVNILVVLLLLLNGTGALYGGLHLIVHPDGSSLGLGMHWIAHTAFDNYLIPGLLLFVFNGLFSFVVLILLLTRNRLYPLFTVAQGVTLVSWIVVQVILINTFNYMHLTMGLTGLGLVAGGYWLTIHARLTAAA